MLEGTSPKTARRLWFDDALLIIIMAVLAGCGLIYEYLLSHYAGRVLGSVESAIYAMIGLMIVAMGLGAFAARWFKQPETAFAWLEIAIAFVGMLAILGIAAVIAFVEQLPVLLSSIYNLPVDVKLSGEGFALLRQWSAYLPYVSGFILGFMIGMEIPLIARVRELVYGRHLVNNTGTIYGADYIGAGVGAAIWVGVMLSMNIAQASAWTASMNLFAGAVFLWRFRASISGLKWLVSAHILALFVLLCLFSQGSLLMNNLAKALYKDHVVFQQQTKYQHLLLTERAISPELPPVIDLYLNGRLQFSSADELIYHSMLVHPAMAASARQDKVLIIGGGDGLALREVQKWQPQQVTLVDLDPDLIALFSEQGNKALPAHLHERLLQLNNHSFSQENVQVINNDAFLQVEAFVRQQKQFDVIIIDLPDPNHPDLNKMYSVYFYARVKQILAADGAVVIQSTSPFHAKQAFISIGKTLAAGGFHQVEQYRQNVPSFGEWGWTIATKNGASASIRLKNNTYTLPSNSWVTPELISSAFVFPSEYYKDVERMKINELGSGVLYQYHYNAWTKQVGVFHATDKSEK